MSRITKWKLEKTKVKVVFRLQFHASQIPQSGWEKLFINFIPTESGKATAKTSKANVRNGTCKWADPIYETTRLLLDSKSKQYDDKLYKLVVGMGTSRSSILGEATINLADYADASQPSVINLPLHGSDHGTILHVTVQLLTAKTGFGEFQQQRDKGLQRESESSTAKSASLDSQSPDEQLNKGKIERQVRQRSKDLLEETGIHEEYSDSHVTCDDSSNTSETYYADKNDSPIGLEVDSIKNKASRKRDNSDDVAVYEENQRLRGSLEVAESAISELKLELNTLQNHANEMSTETQKLQQDLVTEIASSQELAKEVKDLKSECLKFKTDLQQLKELKKSNSTVNFLEIPKIPLQETEVVRELDMGKAERESLVKKMEQMESYYEALVQELEENQKKILGEFQVYKNETNDQMIRFDEERNELNSIIKDLQKRATTSESALKRARLNYSIAVSQLQKDLDMLSFQVLSMFETNQTVIKEAFSDEGEKDKDLSFSDHRSKSFSGGGGGGDVLSGDLKKSLSLQENIYKKVEEEIGEMCALNLYLDVYSGAVSESLIEANDQIRRMKEKLKVLSESRDVLVVKLESVEEDVNMVNLKNSYYVEKLEKLEVQNEKLEKDLGSVSRENFLLMEKITECDALLMDYRVYKSKYEVVSGEKGEVEGVLEGKVFEIERLEKELEFLKGELESLRSENLEVEGVLEGKVFEFEKLEKELEFVKGELESVRSENLDLEKEKDLARLEVCDLKKRFKKDLEKLEMPNKSLEKIQFQVESVLNKLKNGLDLGESHLENSEVFLRNLSSMELELQKISLEDKNFVDQVKELERMGDELEKSKLMISELKKENQDLMMDVENKHDEFGKLMLEVDRMKECLRCVNDELEVEKGIKGKLEGTIASLTLDLESQRLELDHVRKLASNQETENSRVVQILEQHETRMHEIMICEDLKLTFVKSQYESKTEDVLKLCKELEKENLDKDSRLNDFITSESQYIKENEDLSRTLESLRLELEVSVKDCKELQSKLHDMEERLNEVCKSEAHYIEENEKLVRTVESVKLELEASIAHNAEILESKNVLVEWKDKAGMFETTLMEVNNQHALKLGQLEELEMKLHDTESRLNQSLENEGRYVKENGNLAKELESVKLELEESLEFKNVLEGKVGNLEVSLTEVKNQHEVELCELKDTLAKYELEVEKYKEIQIKLQETETRLNEVIKSEAFYIEENEKLSRTLESVQIELKDSIAQKAEVLESKNVREGKLGLLEINLGNMKNQHEVELSQLKDMLGKSELEVEKYKELQMKLDETETRLNELVKSEACYIEENGKLSRTLESVQLELESLTSQNTEILEANNNYALEIGQLKDMLVKSESEIGKLEMKIHDTEAKLNICLENEARYIEENEKLSRILESVRLELESSIARNAEISEAHSERALEIGQLKEMSVKYEAEIGKLKELETELFDTKTKLDQIPKSEAFYIEENESLKSELDVLTKKVLFLENNKVTEVDDVLFSREESEILLVVLKSKLHEQNDELITLKNKCNELANKLSEQISKTEEFKNQLIYLKELKESSEIAREKKEPEGPSESLRLAFIKEQYQAKIQELKQQLSVSKRHNEEMLFKLQDALDEIESRKKSEVLQLKRIDELEKEIESVVSEKPDYDRIQAELECAILSLECCKEEKEKLVVRLQECEEEKEKLVVRLQECEEEKSKFEEQLALKDENGHVGVNGESERSISPTNLQVVQRGVLGEDEENSLLNDSKQLTVINDQFKAQHLRSYMDQLDEELEKMKNDNSILPLTNYDPGFQDLQSELSQLQKANEELGSIYPNFVDFPGNGNALERVLALEIELAEALRAKKKSSIQFQSSFLKQHSDEEAVFKSFRDINELIKDMLEIKGKYVNVETELKEMHDRYSQLSLQFAEVEGERQKLMMTLKNVRSSRNLLRSNRSSMAAIEDRPL